LNLLCHISDRSEKGRSIIGDRLYGTKEHVDFDLQQLAPYFGKTIDGDDANHMAMEVAKDIRLQVQRYKDGDKVNRPMVILASFTGHTADEKVIVHVYVFSAFDALLQYRKLLSAGSITELVAAATAMIFDTENIPANKVGLLNRIIRLADCLSPEIAEQLFENLLPLAKGEQLYLKDALRGFGDPQNPLNAFKIDMQSAEDVQTAALFTLAKIEEHHSGIYGQRLRPILEDAMADANPKVRGMAFAGVKRINVLGESLLTNLLLGTRDPDPNVATHAFNALAVNDSLSFSDEQWVSLVHSLALAASSSVSTVRRDAAFVIVKRESQWKGSPVEQKMKELKAIYGTDVCWSVRATISQSE
jgi:hypothetical protein